MGKIKTVSVRFNGSGSRALFDVENEQHATGLAEVVDYVKSAMLDPENNDSFSVSVGETRMEDPLLVMRRAMDAYERRSQKRLGNNGQEEEVEEYIR